MSTDMSGPEFQSDTIGADGWNRVELDHSATRLLPGLVPGEAILMGVDFPCRSASASSNR